MMSISTSDFRSVGTFYRKDDGAIVFLTKGEETLFKVLGEIDSSIKFIPMLDIDIKSLYMPEEDSTTYRNLLYVAAMPEIPLPIDIKGYRFFDKLGITYYKTRRTSSSFPAPEFCRAMFLITTQDKVRTENRLKLCDVNTRKLHTDELPVSRETYMGKPTINPKSFDDWMILLHKASSFRTLNKDYILLKSIFDIK